jgi:dienelactone hydrolase
MNYLLHALLLLVPQQVDAAPPPAEVKASFLKLLDRPRVPLDVKVESSDTGRGLTIEYLSFASEKKADGATERVPTLVVRPADDSKRRPAVIVLHGTGGSKEGSRSWLNELAARGFVAVAIDGRYHGGRTGGGKGTEAYNQAIVRAWRSKPGEPQEHPFYYDTCWDVWRTVDYLQTRPDVDPSRIGLIGISKGGIETWLAGAVDDRIKVAVPAISVQSFRWGLDHDQWQGRARTIAAAHDAAAKDLIEPAVNAKVCRALWDKVIPGVTGPYDCPSMLRLFAGRPLLILNGSEDPNCPIGGARLAFASAEAAYREAGTPDKLKIMVAEGVGHSVTGKQHEAAMEWFVRWLAP